MARAASILARRSTTSCPFRPGSLFLRNSAEMPSSVCADASMLSDDQIDAIARAVIDAQRSLIALALGDAVSPLGQRPGKAVIAGQGEFLARRILEGWASPEPEIISMAERFGPDVSHAACAFALAHLAADDEGGE